MENLFKIGEEVLGKAYFDNETDKRYLIFSNSYLIAFREQFVISDTKFRIIAYHKYNTVLVELLDEDIKSSYVQINGDCIFEMQQLGLHIEIENINKYVAFVNQDILIKSNSNLEGHSCFICKDYYEFAVANQLDGNFACYRCKTDPRNNLKI